MKKLAALALSISIAASLSACTGMDQIVVKEDGSIGHSKSFHVIQVLDRIHALALTCESKWSDYCSGDVALIVVPDDTLLYDGKRITIQNPIVRDTYSYETMQGLHKTVPVVEQAPDSTVP